MHSRQEKVVRHLRLVKPIEEANMTVKIAFATSDRRAVNQHFGAAEAFAVYELGERESRLVEVAEFIETAMDGHEGKLAAKVELLGDCAAVYCNAVGASAIQQLLAKSIQPMRVEEGVLIDELLQGLQKNLLNDPPVWLAKHLKKQAHGGFDADEEWQE
jgi:nitrogen fixation protein NifX